jgi:hypothetical protein
VSGWIRRRLSGESGPRLLALSTIPSSDLEPSWPSSVSASARFFRAEEPSVPRLPSGAGSTSAKPGSQPLCNTWHHSPSPACGHYRRPSGLQTARTGPKPGSLCRTALSRPTSSRRPPRGLPLPSRTPTSPTHATASGTSLVFCIRCRPLCPAKCSST